jgi:hypothetical protein
MCDVFTITCNYEAAFIGFVMLKKIYLWQIWNCGDFRYYPVKQRRKNQHLFNFPKE